MKGVIFDLDGVLVFTDKFHYLAWKTIADKEGIYFDEKINNRLRGVSRMASLDIILENAKKTYTDEEKVQLANEKNETYRKFLSTMTPNDVTDDVRNTLQELKNKGIKLAIGSSSKNTKYILEKVQLTSYFDAICDGNDITKSKPDPEVFIKAAEMLNLNCNECYVIEDAIAGIDAANAGGFISCGIQEEAFNYDKTQKPINSLKDILSFFDDCAIKLEHVGKVYPNGVRAVKDFSLEIKPGEFVVFVGPSGCGKSTVLRMIAGLEEITEGSLYISGVRKNDSEPKDRNLSMVFQNYALYPHLTVRKNIAFPLSVEKPKFKQLFSRKYYVERKKRINEKVEEVAKQLGLYELLDRKPKNLSGGQRQRVALGRAIVRNPVAFLLDEPLSNLDAKMRAQMRTEISKLHNELKTIFIYVTHDQIEAMTMGSKIVVMKDGVIQQIATPIDLYNNPINMFVAGFIGTPQMNFINATLDTKNTIVLNESHIKLNLPESISSRIDKEYIGKEIVLGVRPKAVHTKYDSNYESQNIKVKINLFEQLGEEILLYCSMQGKEGELISSTSCLGKFNNGEEIDICFDLSSCCLFDKKTQISILK